MPIAAVRLAPPDGPPLAGGPFRHWLLATARALVSGGHSDVPCGDCTACCEGAYFIRVRPSDTAAISRIPQALLFPAPGGATGERVMGYDDRGRCPMLRAGACTIYADRPATCRTYDCRIFAATGLAEPGPEKAAIMARAARWRFDYEDRAALAAHDSLRDVAWALLDAQPLARVLPGNATQLAMLVIRHHELLLSPGFLPEDHDSLARLSRAIGAA